MLIHKFEEVDLKYDHSLLRLQPKNTLIRQFSPKVKIYLFYMKLCIIINPRVPISNIKIAFSIPGLKLPKKAFWSQIYGNSIFARKFTFRKLRRC